MKKRSTGRFWHPALGLGLLLTVISVARLKADPVFVSIDFSITFTPPSPITPPDPIFGPFTGGLFHFQENVTPPNIDQTILVNVIDFQLPDVQPGQTFTPPNPIIPPDPITPPSPIVPAGSLEISLTGFSGGFPVIAFGTNALVPDTVPPSPIIPIGTFGADLTLGSQLTANGDLFAYDAPVQVGTWSVTATLVPSPVPEPVHIALVVPALLALAAVVRQRWLNVQSKSDA